MKDKGITLISLVITIIVMLILSATVTVNIKQSTEIGDVSELKTDITNLKKKVENFYKEYGEIPAEIEYTNISKLSNVLNTTEKESDSMFYVIDLQAMKGISLNYGRDYENIKNNPTHTVSDYEDLYIINNKTHNIFYVAGVRSSDTIYYTTYTEAEEVPNI